MRGLVCPPYGLVRAEGTGSPLSLTQRGAGGTGSHLRPDPAERRCDPNRLSNRLSERLSEE